MIQRTYQGYKNNDQYSKFAQHIIDTGHKYDTMGNTMKLLHIEEHGKMLNAYERLYVYEATEQGTQLYDILIEGHNPIYNVCHNNISIIPNLENINGINPSLTHIRPIQPTLFTLFTSYSHNSLCLLPLSHNY
jgi:hypothetical protein